jgi:hypothetical protein
VSGSCYVLLSRSPGVMTERASGRINDIGSIGHFWPGAPFYTGVNCTGRRVGRPFL